MWVTRHWHAQAILTTSTETVLSKMLQSDKQTPAATNRDARAMAEPGVLTAMLNWYRAIPLSDVRRVRHKITLPTMYVWSDGDTALLEKGARDCRRYVSGHLPIRDPARDALDTQRATRRGRRPAARMARRPSRLSQRRYRRAYGVNACRIAVGFFRVRIGIGVGGIPAALPHALSFDPPMRWVV